MANRIAIGIILFCIFLQSGCALITKHQEITTLSELSDAQEDITHYVERQDEGFAHLLDDIEHDRLEKGIAKDAIAARYGQPVTCQPFQGKTYSQACLYRKPIQYFNTNVVYLYLDDELHLTGWKLQPADCAREE